MTENALINATEVVVPDIVLEEAQRTGKLPTNWWTSDACWKMLAKLSGQFSNSSMVPSAYRNEPGNVIVALAAGMPLGLSPLACLQSVAVINGKPTLYGDAPIAQVLAHPSLLSIVEDTSGTISAGDREHVITIKRKLRSGETQSTKRSFGIQDAKLAKLWGKTGPWVQYPDRMLFNRARALAVRDAFADVLQGTTFAADNTEPEVVKAIPVQQEPLAITITQGEDLKTAHAPAKSADTKEARHTEAKAKKAKPRKGKAQEIADKAAEKLVTSQGETFVGEWNAPTEGSFGPCHRDAKEGDCMIDFNEEGRTAHMRHYRFGEWNIVNEGHTLHAMIAERISEGLRKRAASIFASLRWGAEEAKDMILSWTTSKTGKLSDLTFTQLADVVDKLK